MAAKKKTRKGRGKAMSGPTPVRIYAAIGVVAVLLVLIWKRLIY
jgi:hypothetical protein